MNMLRRFVVLALIVLFIVPLVHQTTIGAASETQATPVGWNIQTIDNTGNLDLGQRTSLAISPVNNRPYISYYNATNKDVRLAIYLGTPTSGSCSFGWACSTVD